jgi:phosphonate transport system substrate-binding protein
MPKYNRIKAFMLAAALFTPSLAFADWRKELGTFRIGFVETETKMLTPGDLAELKAVFAKQLAMPVEIFQARDLPSLIDAHVSSRIEYAVYSAAAYATAWLACQCIEPLASPVNADGTSGFKSMLLTADTVTLVSLAASKGIGIQSADSLLGTGVPLAAFQFSGLALSGSETWLVREDSMAALVELYRGGKVDGLFAVVPSSFDPAKTGGTLSAVFAAMSATPRKPKSLWTSAAVPYGPHAVRKNLAPEAKSIVTQTIGRLAETNIELADLLLPDNAVGFVPISHGAYDLEVKAAKALAAVSGAPAPLRWIQLTCSPGRCMQSHPSCAGAGSRSRTSAAAQNRRRRSPFRCERT